MTAYKTRVRKKEIIFDDEEQDTDAGGVCFARCEYSIRIKSEEKDFTSSYRSIVERNI